MIPFLKPDLIYKTDVTTVQLADIKKLAVEGLLIDLDNTLIAPKTARISLPVKYWLDVVKRHFKIVILTNNKKKFYLEACEQVLELPVIGFAHKPWKKGAIEAQKILNLENKKIAVIGDRPLTDIWLAQRNGFKSILVKALMADVEPKWKYLLRKLEWSFVTMDIL